ncbi:DUF4352 domain-containing protein [Mycetocola sp. 2940]|uniref:DUF4352 domain-containing protein n=1 Tax=Mycetocola sp. 2940 TaxID=3156452 RepID=UPI003392CC84
MTERTQAPERRRRTWWIVAGVVAALAVVIVLLTVVLTPTRSGVPLSTPEPTPTSTSTASPSTATPSSSAPPATPSASPGELPGIGEESTTPAGVSLRVDEMECGLASAGAGTPPPTGEYCSVTFTVANDGAEAIDVLTTDLHGHVGDTTYEAVTEFGRLGDDMSTATVLPGSAIDGVLFFDVPAGSALDTLSITGTWFDGAVDVSAPTAG